MIAKRPFLMINSIYSAASQTIFLNDFLKKTLTEAIPPVWVSVEINWFVWVQPVIQYNSKFVCLCFTYYLKR